MVDFKDISATKGSDNTVNITTKLYVESGLHIYIDALTYNAKDKETPDSPSLSKVDYDFEDFADVTDTYTYQFSATAPPDEVEIFSVDFYYTHSESPIGDGELNFLFRTHVENPYYTISTLDAPDAPDTQVVENVRPALIGPTTKLVPLTMTVKMGVPWGNNTMKTDSGRTITTNSGSQAPRISIDGIINQTQLQTLKQIRNNTDEVRIVSNVYTGFANFDTLRIDEAADKQRINTSVNGRNTTEQQFTFQIQTKAQSSSEEQETITSNVFN